jgi:hypothetical protein
MIDLTDSSTGPPAKQKKPLDSNLSDVIEQKYRADAIKIKDDHKELSVESNGFFCLTGGPVEGSVKSIMSSIEL